MTEATGPTMADAGLELLETLGRPVLDSQPKLVALIRSQLSADDAADITMGEATLTAWLSCDASAGNAPAVAVGGSGVPAHGCTPSCSAGAP